MADVSQVLTTFTGLVETAIYPNGTSQPSVAGVDVQILAGYPIRSKLDQQITAGKAMVSVFGSGRERPVTKFERVFKTTNIATATIIATVNNNTVTITGTVTVPQSVMIIVNRIGYSYQVLVNDTLNSIASALANLIPNAVALNNVITIGNVYDLIARIATQATLVQELSRVDQVFEITCFAPTVAIRTALGSAIRQYIDTQYLVPMVDGVYAFITYYGTMSDDDMESKSNILIRRIDYLIQYATTLQKNVMTIADPYSIIST